MSTNNTTPNAVDPFARFMADAYDEKEASISVPTAFQAFFGNPTGGGRTYYSPDSLVVDIDIIRGNKRIAALIPRGMVSRPLGDNQKNMNVEKSTNFSRKFPLSEEEGDLTGDQLLFRLAGEQPYQSATRFQRMRALALKQHHESIRRTVRMFEVLAAQSVLEGKQDAILDTTNTDLQYDFKRRADHIVTVGTAWNGVTPDILGDIDSACDKLEANGNINPNMICMGGQALDAFIKDTTVAGIADNRRFELLEVTTNNPVPPMFNRFVNSGWIPRGRLRTPKGYTLWIFTNTRTYTNSAGSAAKHMPEDEAFVTSAEARCDRYFGPPEILPMIPQRSELYMQLFGFNPDMAPMPPRILGDGAIIEPSMFYCDAYVAGDWKKVTIRTQSAPIFATTQTDAFVTLKGLVT